MTQSLNKDFTRLMCFPKYLFDDEIESIEENKETPIETLNIVTGPIKMVRNISRYYKNYQSDDESSNRAFFYIPKNEVDPNSLELFNCIQKIDDYMDEEINNNNDENSQKFMKIHENHEKRENHEKSRKLTKNHKNSRKITKIYKKSRRILTKRRKNIK